jgi:hypothetical protein
MNTNIQTIGVFLTTLPSDGLFIFDAKTQAQQMEWHRHRGIHHILSQCWTARFTGGDDPLAKYQGKKGEPGFFYDRCWLTIDIYEQVWGLVQLSEGYIREKFTELKSEYPFESALDLFLYILLEQANENYSICLRPYVEISARKIAEGARLLSKADNLNPIQMKKAKALSSYAPDHKWLTFLLVISTVKATNKRKALKSKLEQYNRTVSKYLEAEATFARECSGFAWNNGEILASKRGGNYTKKS